MAEFNFYGSWDDSIEILEKLICLQRFSFFIRMIYTEPNPITFKVLDDNIIKILEEHSSVFIWSDANSSFSPNFFEYDNEKMDINLNQSGPAMDFQLAKISYTKEKKQLGNGWISVPTSFINPMTGESYKPNKAFRNEYEIAKRTIKECLVKRHFSARKVTTQGKITYIADTIWIGKKSIAHLESGEVSIQIYGEWIDFNDLKENKEEVQLNVDEDDS